MNRRTLQSLSAGLALLLGAATVGRADPYRIAWLTVDGGGALWASGGSFELSGTVGQPDAGVVMTAGPLQLTGGFWVVTLPVSGDVNCDGVVDFDDIDYFVAAIPDNVASWTALYAARHGGVQPPCSFQNGDCNGDGHVNFLDIDPFVALIPSTCP